MNSKVFNQIPLYRFLKFCEDAESASKNKTILDCGAGGNRPPLSLFHDYGYTTTGVELSIEQVEMANAYGRENHQNLNILEGDMTQLKFEDASFDFVYSYNSIFHMKKVEIEKSIKEMKRVLKPGGLMFVNFLSVDDFRCGEGPHLGENQYEQTDDEPVIHSYFDYDEAEKYFKDMTFVLKERRIIERIFEGARIKQGFIDYILRK
ncbi:class I SAM-dependent methyltransferase [Fusibacter ferrireducens]|uniref:Class I SAM-dependent methyltransferase n=1 Tax=Fusibacter ferrireducens TaxID=2785058 RepID=A0ABR9ZMM0_9FIRM|nr:class I SAM-dependent methyltransferase [Fusibacter ferrireducens]MBF4691566.1 class I SAM-dependent methyltransferase [Fusibacter ferrireducens]